MTAPLCLYVQQPLTAGLRLLSAAVCVGSSQSCSEMSLMLSAQVTTYQILTSDFNKEKKSDVAVNRFPPIGKIKWHRSAAPLTCCCVFISLALHACMAQSALGMSTQVSICTICVGWLEPASQPGPIMILMLNICAGRTAAAMHVHWRTLRNMHLCIP